VIEEVDDLLVGKDDGKPVMAADAWEVLFAPRHFEGVEIEELDGGDDWLMLSGESFFSWRRWSSYWRMASRSRNSGLELKNLAKSAT